MKTRVITGVLLAVIIIPLFVLGGWFLNGLLIVLSMIATFELFRLYNTKKSLPLVVGVLYILLSGVIYGLMALHYYHLQSVSWLEMVFLGMIMVLVIDALLLVFIDDFNSECMGEMLVAVLYPSIGFAAMYGLRVFGLLDIGFLFLITIVTDTFAYIVGVNFGKHRLALKISPKKSIEGSIGGTVFALIFTLVYIWVFNIDSLGDVPLKIGVSIGLIIGISIISQIGDLVASKLKRHMGIKDFGRLFPGHGGVMDRFDSVLFAAMFVMFLSGVVGIL